MGAIEHVLAGLGATAGDDALAVVPAQELLDDAREAIRVARVGDRVVTYLPRTTALKFKLDGARDWTATVLDMEDKRIAKLPSATTVTAPCAWPSIPLSTTRCSWSRRRVKENGITQEKRPGW